MQKMTRKVGKITRAGHQDHKKLKKGNPLTKGGNFGKGSGRRSGGRRSSGY